MKNRIILALTLLSAVFAADPLQAASSTLVAAAEPTFKHCVAPMPVNLTGAKSLSSKSSVVSSSTNTHTTITTDAAYAYGNADALREVTAAFYTQNSDVYDFIFVFSNFEFPIPGGAGGYYSPVRNSVAGINMPSVDYGAALGSPKQLQGVINMLWNSQYSFNRTNPNYLTLMKTAMHEMMHRYGSDVAYIDGSGQRKTDLSNSFDRPHWSYALDTDASIMYGARWTLQSGSTYSATQIFERLHPLDMYLAGWTPASAVPPLKLLNLSTPSTDRVPPLGTAVQTSSVSTIPMTQIIAAEGARVPAFPDAQRKYRAAIVFLTRPGQAIATDRYLELEMFRTTFEDYFDAVTGGRASINFTRATREVPTAPSPLTTSQPTGGNGLASAVNWLDSRASAAVPIVDRSASQVRDMMSIYLALVAAKPSSTNIPKLLTWLKQASVKSSDAAAAVLAADPSDSAALSKLMLSKIGNRFALTENHAATSFDSALAASVLSSISGQESLAAQLRTDLGNAAIGYTESGQARLIPTIQAVVELKKSAAHAAQLPALQSFIRSKYQTDGSFLEGSERNILAAALVLQNGAALGFSNAELDLIETRLKLEQHFSGSIGNSVYLTSNAVLGFERQSRPDLQIEGFVTPVSPVYVGEFVPVRFKVRNSGRTASAAAKLTLVERQADGSYRPIANSETDLPSLASNALSQEFSLQFDTTARIGANDLAVLVDSSRTITERNESNNTQMFSVSVSAAPTQPELSIGPMTLTENI
jgi:CARDB